MSVLRPRFAGRHIFVFVSSLSLKVELHSAVYKESFRSLLRVNTEIVLHSREPFK